MDESSVERTPDAEHADGRRRRGAQSRNAITRRAVDIASEEGLYGLSFGRLADDLSISKAGIQTLFRTKEQLQLATVDQARLVFVDFVIRPAYQVPEGLTRLRALIDNWMDYAARPLFPGGCFWAANLPEFDSRPGPIRDALAKQRQEWIEVLAREVDTAINNGEIVELDADLAAFQIYAVLNAANIALRLGDTESVSKVHRVVDNMLTPPAVRR